MDKNKKIITGVIITFAIGIIGYTSVVLVEMKKSEGYVTKELKMTLDEVYRRNEVILSNKIELEKNIPEISVNINNIEKLVNSENSSIGINERIGIANDIESNVTKVIKIYKNKEKDLNNDTKKIMKKIIELDEESKGWQHAFNEMLEEDNFGYNELYVNQKIHRPIAKIYGLTNIDLLKSE